LLIIAADPLPISFRSPLFGDFFGGIGLDLFYFDMDSRGRILFCWHFGIEFV